MELLQSILTEWNKNTNECAKLQQAYVAIVITGVVVAGIITLLNPNLGHTIIVFTDFCLLLWSQTRLYGRSSRPSWSIASEAKTQ